MARRKRKSLCVWSPKRKPNEIVTAVGSEFRQLFNTRESLDILFLSPLQHERIQSVAKPFYRRDDS